MKNHTTQPLLPRLAKVIAVMGMCTGLSMAAIGMVGAAGPGCEPSRPGSSTTVAAPYDC